MQRIRKNETSRITQSIRRYEGTCVRVRGWWIRDNYDIPQKKIRSITASYHDAPNLSWLFNYNRLVKRIQHLRRLLYDWLWNRRKSIYHCCLPLIRKNIHFGTDAFSLKIIWTTQGCRCTPKILSEKTKAQGFFSFGISKSWYETMKRIHMK